MTELSDIHRVVVIADTALERVLLAKFLTLGAKGYNCVYCFGKGQHETMEDPYTGRSQVRIEILTREKVALAIMDYIHKEQFDNYPVTGYVDIVKVDHRDAGIF